MGISDLIASFLQDSLDTAEDGVLEVQRSELAQRFNCVPSQINYVMSTRFSPERGYIVESRRGGNGYIRITRVQVDRQTLMMHVINSLGSSVDLASARAILSNLVQSGALERDMGQTILTAVGDKALSRGKEIFKPLNTGWIDKNVACVREWVANIFFYCKDNAVIMIDAGYNYDRLAEKMGWLGIAPQSVQHILITHQDTDHVGAVEADSPGLFQNAALYIGEVENRYLTGEVRRKVIYHLYKLPQVTINNKKVLLRDGEVINIDGIKIECFLVPGHTWGHMVYLVDDRYLFTGDTIWFGADGGYSFISALAEDNELAVRSLTALEEKLRRRDLHPLFITGHTGWTDNMDFAFAHKNELCSPFRKKAHDPNAPYDAYDESDDTEERANSRYLAGVGR